MGQTFLLVTTQTASHTCISEECKLQINEIKYPRIRTKCQVFTIPKYFSPQLSVSQMRHCFIHFIFWVLFHLSYVKYNQTWNFQLLQTHTHTKKRFKIFLGGKSNHLVHYSSSSYCTSFQQRTILNGIVFFSLNILTKNFTVRPKLLLDCWSQFTPW